METERCIDCGGDPNTPKGVIYVRRRDERLKMWVPVPLCPACWEIRHPNVESVFLKDPEEHHELHRTPSKRQLRENSP
jgi:hypothetical protein